MTSIRHNIEGQNVLKRNSSPLKENEPKTKKPSVKKATLVELSLGDLATFGKQRQAIEEFQKLREVWKDELRIFSYELKGGSGERRYLVSTIQRFWKWYRDQDSRHMYELIYEDMPCRLYFDLEYPKEHNTNVNLQRTFDHFTASLAAVLADFYNLTLDIDKNLLILESSTETKFSAHVICHLENDLLFPNSMSIRELSDELSKRLLENPPEKLKNADGREIPLFDAGVYSRNRNFRLFLSSKMGKSARLELADYCKFYDVRGIRKPCELRIFQDSLCVPPEYHKFPLLRLKDTKKDENSTVRPETKERSNVSATHKGGQGPSPFPTIDDFMQMVLRKWTPSVHFREWKIQEKEGRVFSITYYPSNSRYCFNIGREHKSNGTWWTVDLSKGHFYQKCFDPDCRGYSSNYFPLPDFIKNVNKPEEEKDQSILDASRIEVETFFTNWDSVFDS